MTHSQELLSFAMRWHRYDGGEPEDILVEFGLTEVDYFTRLRDVVRNAGLDDDMRNAMDRLAVRRLLIARDRALSG